MRCVDLYNQAQSKWFEEMVTTTLVSDQTREPVRAGAAAREALGGCCWTCGPRSGGVRRAAR